VVGTYPTITEGGGTTLIEDKPRVPAFRHVDGARSGGGLSLEQLDEGSDILETADLARP
jgi:hypothetical protein